MNNKKRAVITGVTGFIGQAICKSLLESNYIVYGIGRSQNKLDELANNKNFKPIKLDFSDYNLISELIQEKEIELFINAAYRGVNGKDKTDCYIQLKNIDISYTIVLQALKLNTKRFIYIGSVDEYEVAKLPDCKFYEPTHSRIYAISKYASEVIGKTISYENKMEFISALLVLTYGENNSTNILPNTIIRNALNSKPINLISGNDYFDMIHISEAVNGIMAIIDKGKPYESYFVGHEKLKTFKELVNEICKSINYTGQLNFGKYADPSFSLDYSQIDRSKLYRDTGYKCDANFDETIKQTQKWLINNDL